MSKPAKGQNLIRFSINLLLLLVSIFLVFGILELALRMELFVDVDDPKGMWVPLKYKDNILELNQENFERAKKNWNWFNNENDIFTVSSDGSLVYRKKKEGTKRIAVLGDSVIWGYGLQFDQIWSIKLKNGLSEKYEDIEVLSWGRPGWNTIDHYNYLAELVCYLESTGEKLELDLLIVGYLYNDVNLRLMDFRKYPLEGSPLFAPIKYMFPNAFDFISTYARGFFSRHFAERFGYRNPADYDYTDEYLFMYRKLLIEFAEYCRLKGIRLLFVMTPSTITEEIGGMHETVIPFLRTAKIDYIDLYPVAARRFGGYNPRKLWANPADSHPGEMLHELFSDEVMEYLEAGGLLADKTFPYDDNADDAEKEMALLTSLSKYLEKQLLKPSPYVILHYEDFSEGLIARKTGYSNKGDVSSP
jgi:lysophospholipase L1-like esterase